MAQLSQRVQRGALNGQASSVTVEELGETLHVPRFWQDGATDAVGNESFEVVAERQPRVRAKQISGE